MHPAVHRVRELAPELDAVVVHLGGFGIVRDFPDGRAGEHEMRAQR